MAATVTEQAVVKLGGGLMMLTGVAATAGGTTSFVLKPGSNDVNKTGSGGLRKILAFGFQNETGARALRTVKAYDATQDGDIVTCTCTANDTFDFWAIGFDTGVAA
jgi:hypothetical protein